MGQVGRQLVGQPARTSRAPPTPLRFKINPITPHALPARPPTSPSVPSARTPAPARTPHFSLHHPLLELHSAPDPRPDLYLWNLRDHPLLGTTRGGGHGDGRASVQVGTGVRSHPGHTLVYRRVYTHGRTPAALGRNPKTVFGDSLLRPRPGERSIQPDNLLGPGARVSAPPVSDCPATGHLWHFSPAGFRGDGTRPPARRRPAAVHLWHFRPGEFRTDGTPARAGAPRRVPG